MRKNRIIPILVGIFCILATSCSLEPCKCTTYLNGDVYSTYEYNLDESCPYSESRYVVGGDEFYEICN